MIGIQVTIDAEKTLNFLGRLPKQLEQALGRGIGKAALLVEGESKILAPVDTGRLRSSINTKFSRLSAFVSTDVNYAVYVHEGTRFRRARPFMREAVQGNEDKIADVISEEIEKALE